MVTCEDTRERHWAVNESPVTISIPLPLASRTPHHHIMSIATIILITIIYQNPWMTRDCRAGPVRSLLVPRVTCRRPCLALYHSHPCCCHPLRKVHMVQSGCVAACVWSTTNHEVAPKSHLISGSHLDPSSPCPSIFHFLVLPGVVIAMDTRDPDDCDASVYTRTHQHIPGLGLMVTEGVERSHVPFEILEPECGTRL